MTAIVTRGDAGNLHLPDETVDLIVTSPPYFGLRSYQDGGEHYAGQVGSEATPAEYLDALMACTAEWMRVLKPGGSIFVNLGDKYAGSAPGRRDKESIRKLDAQTGRTRVSDHWAPKDVPAQVGWGGVAQKSLIGLPWRYAIRCIDELGLILRAEIVWAKPNGLPESVTDRVRRSHEQVFHFVKQPRYYSAVDEVREQYAPETAAKYAAGGLVSSIGTGAHPSKRNGAIAQDGDPAAWKGNPLGKLPGSVWSIPTAPLKVPASLGIDHFAAYPPELVRRIVLGWSPDGGTVLDPFGGTGTTVLVASAFGRVGISVDLSADYCRLAQWRTADPGERARVLKVDKPPVQVDGQLGMFEGIGA